MLHASLPLKRYEELRVQHGDPELRPSFRLIAQVSQELGTYVRLIAIDLEMSEAVAESPTGLTEGEIQKLVNNYIGVQGGYLADFSYRTHHDFYVELDLDINPYEYEGTTRERFIQILSEKSPDVQAKILEGVLNRFPVGSSDARTQQRADTIAGWIRRLRGWSAIATPSPRVTSVVVERALSDARHLLEKSGPVSAVDRVHTALHGWLKAACDEACIQLGSDPSITDALRTLREKHPKLQITGPRADEITRVSPRAEHSR